MPLVDYIDPDAVTDEVRERILYEHENGETKPSLLYSVLANNPEVLLARSAYSSALRKDGNLDEALKELSHAVVSLTNDCDYCASSHSENLVEVYGLSDEQLRAVVDGDLEGFTDRERAVIEFARQTASDPKRVTNEHVKALEAVGFDDADVIELLTFVSYAVASNTIVDTMNIHPADRDLELPAYHPGRTGSE